VNLSPLLLISDVERVGEERFLSALEAAISAGLRMLQVREPGWSEKRLRDLVSRVRERVRDSVPEALPDVLLVLNRRPGQPVELASELDMDGVHLGGGSPERVAAARAVLGPKQLVGYSAHELSELVEAAEGGATYGSYSPVFGALSKEHPLPSVGLVGLELACRRAPLPVYALGGVTPEHAGRLRRSGAAGAAMIGSILDVPDPAVAVRAFLLGWETARA
jgi:thiamine-phosphate pyrophosphorylase